jgi:hypothetical protein
VFRLLQKLPTFITIASCNEIECEVMKVVLCLKAFMQVAQESLIQVDSRSAAAAHEMVMSLSLYCLIAWLLTQKVVFAHQPQFAQQFQCTVNGRETHIGIALLYTLSNLFDTQMLARFLYHA